MRRVLILFLLFCVASASRAQSLKPWTMAELARRSDVVCVGTVLKVEVIEEKKAEDLLNYTPPPPKRVTVARIKVTSKIKGNVPDEIEMRYPEYTPPQVDWDYKGGRMTLQPLKVYCFYLKRVDGEIWYVSALDGEKEDGAAAQPAGLRPMLSKKDAVQIATVEYLKADPAAVITPAMITASQAKSVFSGWVVRFYSGKRMDDESWDARIVVNQDKSVDDVSVIFGRTGDDYNKALIGKRYELSVLPARSKIPAPVRGVIRKIDARTVTLQTDETGKSTTRIFPKTAIEGMQPLPDPQPAASAQ